MMHGSIAGPPEAAGAHISLNRINSHGFIVAQCA
jgi:hypothetical protein